jgi:AraC-like DNA-binding protein
MAASSPLQLVQWLLLVQCLLLATFLWRRHTLWPLAALLLNLGMQMLWNLGAAQGWMVLPDLRALFAMLYGPLILGLVRHLAWRDRPPLSWPHAVPGVLLVTLFLLSPGVSVAVWPLVSISLAIYLTAAFRELARYHRVLRGTRSNFEAHSLAWLRETLLGLSAVAVIDFSRQMLRVWTPALDSALALGTYAAALLLVCFLIWRGMQQPAIFAGLAREDEAALDLPAPPAQQSAPDLVAAAATLEAHMQARQPHLDPELSVQALAQQLGWPAKQLSALINQHFGRNFNDYINNARVATACTLMTEPGRRGEKLLAIQLDAGFASKSVFNAAFKRVMAMTPSEYRRSLPIP